MHTSRYTPEAVAEEDLRFAIPVYQRLFAWERTQVEGLLDDLKRHFDSSPESPYYLGMLSCIRRDGDRYDLIDGQQRFTLMTLMSVVFRHREAGWIRFLGEGDRLHFAARPDDDGFLRSAAVGTPPRGTNRRMEECLDVIEGFLSDRSRFPDEASARAFCGRVYRHLSFFFSELPSAYAKRPESLNRYFEAMNGSGKGLEQHEILKVRLITGESRQDEMLAIWNLVAEMDRPIVRRQEGEDEAPYRRRCRGMVQLCRDGRFEEALRRCKADADRSDEATIGSIEPAALPQESQAAFSGSGSRSVVDFPQFLMMALDIYAGLGGGFSFYRQDLLSTFRDNPPADKSAFYRLLFFLRLLLDYYVVRQTVGDGLERYELLFSSDAGTAAAEEDRKRLAQYESMLNVSQAQAYRWLKPLLAELKGRPYADPAELLRWIKAWDCAANPCPAGPEELSYGAGDKRYWFWRLDYFLWERRAELFPDEADRSVVDGYVFRTNRSIEHLHPQHQANNRPWPEPDIHSFGNLAMISQGFNSQQGDDPVEVKFARIAAQVRDHALQSVKLFKMFLDAEKVPSNWTVERKVRHQQMMFNVLRQSYPQATEPTDEGIR